MHSRAALLLGALAWSLGTGNLLVACGPASECRNGQFRCDGNVAHNCQLAFSDSGAPHVWVREDCDLGSCRTDSNGAFCALSADPDPLCERSGTACDGNILVRCRDGYATHAHECGADVPAEGSHCLTHHEGAVCALDPEPTIECNPAMSRTQACRDDHILSCEYGLATWQRSCGDGFCRGASDVFCALLPDPDPECPEGRFASYCASEDILVSCRYGYRTEVARCAETLVCQTRDDSRASCGLP